MTFDLTAAVRRHLSDDADPHTIAKAVCDEVGPHDVRAVMEQLMPDAVRKVIHHERMAHRTARAGHGGNGRRDLGALTRDPLRMPYLTESGWKFLGDMTADDCAFVAAGYRTRAAQNAAVADEFESLAERVRAAGVATVGDLGTVVAA